MLVYHMNVKDIQIHDNDNARNDDNENKKKQEWIIDKSLNIKCDTLKKKNMKKEYNQRDKKR